MRTSVNAPHLTLTLRLPDAALEGEHCSVHAPLPRPLHLGDLHLLYGSEYSGLAAGGSESRADLRHRSSQSPATGNISGDRLYVRRHVDDFDIGLSVPRPAARARSIYISIGDDTDSGWIAEQSAARDEMARPLVATSAAGASGLRSVLLCGLCRLLDGRSAELADRLHDRLLLHNAILCVLLAPCQECRELLQRGLVCVHLEVSARLVPVRSVLASVSRQRFQVDGLSGECRQVRDDLLRGLLLDYARSYGWYALAWRLSAPTLSDSTHSLAVFCRWLCEYVQEPVHLALSNQPHSLVRVLLSVGRDQGFWNLSDLARRASISAGETRLSTMVLLLCDRGKSAVALFLGRGIRYAGEPVGFTVQHKDLRQHLGDNAVSGASSSSYYYLPGPTMRLFRSRFIWNFFRLENEHLNNVGHFRANRDIHLKALSPQQERMLQTMMHEPQEDSGSDDNWQKHHLAKEYF